MAGKYLSLGHGRFNDMTGVVFSRLTAISYVGDTKWLCKCECGATRIVEGGKLRNGKTKSCGCFTTDRIRKQAITHGQSFTAEYKTWQHMLARCGNPRLGNYADYGGRGIAVCDRWLNSFENFKADMGPKPSAKHSIDRIDNDGNYEPGNCRWATRAEQSRNTSRNRWYTFRDETLTLMDWSERIGMNYITLRNRLNRGMAIEEALTRPVQRRVAGGGH